MTMNRNGIPADLEWLARNLIEWESQSCNLVCKSDDNNPWYFVGKDGDHFNGLPSFTKIQWLQARRDLGLVMSESEEQDYAPKPDMVNEPPHYQLREGYEVYDLRQDLARKAQAAGVPHDQFSDWDRALEYLLRMWEKNGVEDAKKAAWYVNKLIGKMELEAKQK